MFTSATCYQFSRFESCQLTVMCGWLKVGLVKCCEVVRFRSSPLALCGVFVSFFHLWLLLGSFFGCLSSLFLPGFRLLLWRLLDFSVRSSQGSFLLTQSQPHTSARLTVSVFFNSRIFRRCAILILFF